MTYTLEELQEMMDKNGGFLALRGCTGLTSLPENLTVGGFLDLRGCTGLKDEAYEEKKVKKLTDGEYVPGRYLYADGILTHVKRKRTIGKYTYYQGKIKGKNVVFDGEHYAHCKSLKDGVCDLEFKKAKERGSEQYKHLTLDSEVTKDEAITMYRIITGACRAGTDNFLSGIKEFKEKYTVREIVELTTGQYGGDIFKRFFKED